MLSRQYLQATPFRILVTMELKHVLLCSLVIANVWGAVLRNEDFIYPDVSMMLEGDDIPEIDFTLGNIAKDVKFYLYTPEYNEDYELVMDDLVSVQNSTFNASRPTKVAIHGYEHSYKDEAVQLIRYAYVTHAGEDVNVIGVEWSKLCEGPPLGIYVEAYLHVPKVGKVLGQFLDFLINATNANVEDFHLIGHSLGAHLAAFAANTVTSGSIPRISGLDPALPLYGSRSASHRLDPTDAAIVDCIHTCGGFYGFYKPLGTHDFYPNGGKPVQPGCGLDIERGCSHAVVVRYYAESVFDKFEATGCALFSDVKEASCNGTVGYMGDPAPSSPEGIYYLETNGAYPYVKN